MQLKNPKKTLKILYLYMTVPLLLVAMVMGSVWFLAAKESREADDEPAAAKASDKGEEHKREHTVIEHMKHHCSVKGDCRIGESCLDGHCVNILRETVTRQPAKVKTTDDGMGTTGWAAIIAALMGGLTGLLGAVTQTVIAFIKARERRRGA